MEEELFKAAHLVSRNPQEVRRLKAGLDQRVRNQAKQAARTTFKFLWGEAKSWLFIELIKWTLRLYANHRMSSKVNRLAMNAFNRLMCHAHWDAKLQNSLSAGLDQIYKIYAAAATLSSTLLLEIAEKL